MRGQRHRYRGSHQLQQDSHPASLVQSLQTSNQVGEGTCGDFDALSFTQVEIEIDMTLGVRRKYQILDQALRHGLRLSSAHEQAINT